MPTIHDFLLQAEQSQQAGDSDQAEAISRHILAHAPDCAAAWHLLGAIAASRGRLDEALACHSQAARLLPGDPAIQCSLGQVQHALGHFPEAEAAYRRALELDPANASTHANLGAVLQQQAQLENAAASYRRTIQLKPDFVEALVNLAAICHQHGDLDEAAVHYRRATEHQPEIAEFHTYLGAVLKDQGHLKDAIIQHRRALALNPNLARAHGNLAQAFHEQDQFAEAIDAFQSALALEEQFEWRLNLGTAYFHAGRIADAIHSYRQAIVLRPQSSAAYNNLGIAYQDHGRLAEAQSAYEQAIALDPTNAQAHNNLGVVYQDRCEFAPAVACFCRALQAEPRFCEAFNNLAVSLQFQDQLDEAADALQQALALKPDFADAYSHLGNVRKDQARHADALACFHRALAHDPNSQTAHSNLCFALQFCPGVTAAEIYAEHQRWNVRHAAAIEKNVQPHANNRDPNRRLKIGYVSPDFRNHCQVFFTKPLFSNHNHRDFEIFCYSDVPAPDAITTQLKTYADHWRDISGQSASQTADLIRADQIDVLVDLTMHMKRSHLLVFAHKPAPVQICWLAYPGTTGLTTIDYRLTDPYLDPPGFFDQYYSEQSIRLPDTFWCYDPLIPEPPVNPLPALNTGHITFGSLNNPCKLNDGTLDLFARILAAVAGSHLMILIGAGSHRDRTHDFFVERGIASDRLTFVPRQSRRCYLEQYHQIDIGLDTLPYNGHTTSLDAFWMGVPVVTLVGDTVVGRAGLSQLTNLNLTDLIAHTPDDYITIITKLASDLPRLSHLRSTLRHRLQNSPLMNAPLFTKNIERTYRTIFHRWCTGPAS